jgi:hypothetical protein
MIKEDSIMKKYFYISDFIFNGDKTEVDKVIGYFTDADHYNFLPNQQLSRKEALELITAGNSLFIHDGCYRKVLIKIVRVDNNEYLRVDHQPHPIDYFG